MIAFRTAPVIAATLAVLGASLFSTPPATSETHHLLPNLQPLPASSLRLSTSGDGKTYLRFSTTSWNSGDGPLEIIGRTPAGGKQQVDQHVYNNNDTHTYYPAGSFEWHTGHGHMHFEDYAIYTLAAVNAPGASLRTSEKTTFCIIDTTRMKRVKNAPRRPVYTTCDATVQGMSVGWGDTYGYWLDGQDVDVTGLAGDYTLTIEVDPKDRIIETNNDDNTSTVLLRLAGGSVTMLDGRGP